MRKQNLYLFSLVLAASVWTISCSDATSAQQDTDIDEECSEQNPCEDPNMECNDEGKCVDKTDTPECSDQKPCEDSSKECSADGKCVDKSDTPECSDQKPCEDSSKECSAEGKCVDKNAEPECSDQKPCKDPNQECSSEGKCVDKDAEPECSDQKPCEDSSKECSAEGKCVDKNTEPECSEQKPCEDSSKECSAEGKCVDKYTEPECSEQKPCADSNQECSSEGKCVNKNTEPECSDQKPCADPGKECNSEGKCVDKTTEPLPAAEADLLDVVFLKDGTAKDISNSHMAVQSGSQIPTTHHDNTFSRYVAAFNSAMGTNTQSYYFIDYSDNANFQNQLADGHSIESLICPKQDYDGKEEIMPFSSFGSAGTGLILPKSSNNESGITFLFFTEDANKERPDNWIISGIVPKKDKCYHFVGTWNKSTGEASIYINGKLRGSKIVSGNLKFPNQKFFGIGAFATQKEGTNAFHGDIAIARIYSDALPPKRIQELYTKTKLSETTPEFNMKVRNPKPFRLSSISDDAMSTGETAYKVFAPYTDQYTLTCKTATKIEVWDAEGNLIASGKDKLTVTLNKGEEIYLKIQSPASKDFLLETTPKDHHIELPFEINTSIDPSSFSTKSTSDADPLKPAVIKYIKRTSERSMYIYSNSPEILRKKTINTCLTSHDITDKDVFFTFEHNVSLNDELKNYDKSKIRYGYRVTNTGSDDLYVTVKNLGLQTEGDWLGEDEWVKFYNLDFRASYHYACPKSPDSMNNGESKTYCGYFNFTNNRTSLNQKPITYRLPSGKYIYVMGGTTSNAYKNINVFNSANKAIANGTSNGAVLFSTYGSKAKGEFVVYANGSESALNDWIKNNIQHGYDVDDPNIIYNGDSKHKVIGHNGNDSYYGVVDSDLVWVFNDKTPAGRLPVSYSNPHYVPSANNDDETVLGKAFEPIPQSLMTTIDASNKNGEWLTHISPNVVKTAVGTDMTSFHTINSKTKADIIADYEHFSKDGSINSIGNWMTDYIDTITLVNQGDKERTFTYHLTPNGALAVFIRKENGLVDTSYTPTYIIDRNPDKWDNEKYGEIGVHHPFEYSVKIPAHTVKQFSVNYNLLANSCGTVTHMAELK